MSKKVQSQDQTAFRGNRAVNSRGSRADRPSTSYRRSTIDQLSTLDHRLLTNRDVPREPFDFLRVHILSNLAVELLHRLVRPVFLELVEHALAEIRDGEDIGIRCRVQVDWNEAVLREARDFLRVDVLPDVLL